MNGYWTNLLYKWNFWNITYNSRTISFFHIHLSRGYFDSIAWLDTTCTEDTLLSSYYIKTLYKNIHHDVFYKAINYWIEKLIDETPLLRRFTKAFILERLSITLEFCYFYINN